MDKTVYESIAMYTCDDGYILNNSYTNHCTTLCLFVIIVECYYNTVTIIIMHDHREAGSVIDYAVASGADFSPRHM